MFLSPRVLVEVRRRLPCSLEAGPLSEPVSRLAAGIPWSVSLCISSLQHCCNRNILEKWALGLDYTHRPGHSRCSAVESIIQSSHRSHWCQMFTVSELVLTALTSTYYVTKRKDLLLYFMHMTVCLPVSKGTMYTQMWRLCWLLAPSAPLFLSWNKSPCVCSG